MIKIKKARPEGSGFSVRKISYQAHGFLISLLIMSSSITMLPVRPTRQKLATMSPVILSPAAKVLIIANIAKKSKRVIGKLSNKRSSVLILIEQSPYDYRTTID